MTVRVYAYVYVYVNRGGGREVGGEGHGLREPRCPDGVSGARRGSSESPSAGDRVALHENLQIAWRRWGSGGGLAVSDVRLLLLALGYDTNRSCLHICNSSHV